MPTEIEKKYRLTPKQRDDVMRQLTKIGARFESEEFEENSLYAGKGIDRRRAVLRVRKVGGRTILTYKERLPSKSSIKHQLEEETEIDDAAALEGILKQLGYRVALVYEKRRSTWVLGEAEIVVDELPFGLFMETEGSAEEIAKIEKQLAIKGLRSENATYPKLAAKHGKKRGAVVEARFSKRKRKGQP